MLSKTILTSANPKDFLNCVPEKIISCDLVPLKVLTLCSPNTQRIASTILLFPDPLGPITIFIPSLISISVFSANDLNPIHIYFF